MSVLRFPKPKQIIVLLRNFCLSVVVEWTQGLSYSTNIVKIFTKRLFSARIDAPNIILKNMKNQSRFWPQIIDFPKFIVLKFENWDVDSSRCIISISRCELHYYILQWALTSNWLRGGGWAGFERKAIFLTPFLLNATQPQQHKWFSWILYRKLQVSVSMHFEAWI